MHKRPDWDTYFMEITHIIAKRSNCLRRQVGAILVKDHRIITTGYNGAPAGMAHCSDLGGCTRERMGFRSGEGHEYCRALHAEQNAVIQAAIMGVSIAGATLYCTHSPCSLCARILIGVGIERVVYSGDYPDGLSKELFAEPASRSCSSTGQWRNKRQQNDPGFTQNLGRCSLRIIYKTQHRAVQSFSRLQS